MATRLYLSSTTAAAVSPAVDPGWTIATGMQRRRCARSPSSSPMTTFDGPFTTGAAGTQSYGVVQFVSDPLSAQVITAQTVRGQVKAKELDANGNFDRIVVSIRVFSNDGATLRGTILSLGAYAAALEFPLGAPTNRKIADGDATTQVIAQGGDRLVVDLGYRSDVPPPLVVDIYASLVFGDDSATDLPADTTTTSGFKPWLEFDQTIVFQGDPLEAFENRILDVLIAVLSGIGTPPSNWLTAPSISAAHFLPGDSIPRLPSEQIYVRHVSTDPTDQSGATGLAFHDMRATYHVYCISTDSENGPRKVLNTKAEVLRALFGSEGLLMATAHFGCWPGPYGYQHEMSRAAGVHVGIQVVTADYEATHTVT